MQHWSEQVNTSTFSLYRTDVMTASSIIVKLKGKHANLPRTIFSIVSVVWCLIEKVNIARRCYSVCRTPLAYHGYPVFYHFLKGIFQAGRGCIACTVRHDLHSILKLRIMYRWHTVCIYSSSTLCRFWILFKEKTLQHTTGLYCSSLLVSEWGMG